MSRYFTLQMNKKKLKMDKGEENFEETVITLASIMISPLSVEV